MLYNDYYEITQDGEIFSYISNRWLKQSISHYGYKFVNLRGQPTLVHRLVALSFIPNPENKPFVNHKNGIKTDNCVSNLEWVTNEENMKHAWKSGLMKSGVHHGQSKFTEEQVHSICQMLSGGYSAQYISDNIGFTVSRARVLDIRARRTWKPIGAQYTWKERATTSRKT